MSLMTWNSLPSRLFDPPQNTASFGHLLINVFRVLTDVCSALEGLAVMSYTNLHFKLHYSETLKFLFCRCFYYMQRKMFI